MMLIHLFIFTGIKPKQFWLVGATIEDVKPSLIDKRICIERATLDTLVKEVKQQLKSHVASAEALKKVVEPVFIIFAVGIYDLAPDGVPVSLLTNLNKLVARERGLLDELRLSCDAVSNIRFATTYPPSMEHLGAGEFAKHAQQYVNLAFRWYNRWTYIVNALNGGGACQLAKPFYCFCGRYKLKITKLAADGVLPSAKTAEIFGELMDKYVDMFKQNYEKEESSFLNDTYDTDLLIKTWSTVKRAEKLYLDAFSGICTTFQVITMPTGGIVSDDTQESKGISQSGIGIVGKAEQQDFSKSMEIEQVEDKVAFAEPPTKIRRVVKDSKTGMPRRKVDADEALEEVAEVDLHMYHVAKSIVQQCPYHIQSKALTLLQEFKQKEAKILEQRLMADRERVSNFQEQMKNIEKRSPLCPQSSTATIDKHQ